MYYQIRNPVSTVWNTFFFFEDDFYSSIREVKMHHKDSTFPVLNTFLGNYPSKHIL